MEKTVSGIVHGTTIQLQDELGLPEGQHVEVTIRATEPEQLQPWGEGLRRCAGALADSWTDEDDRILEEIHQERKSDSRREIAE